MMIVQQNKINMILDVVNLPLEPIAIKSPAGDISIASAQSVRETALTTCKNSHII